MADIRHFYLLLRRLLSACTPLVASVKVLRCGGRKT